MAGREKSTRIVKKLKANEERYRELFDSINVCVAVYKAKEQGEDFVIKDFNSAAERVEKVSRRDIIGKSILTVFPGIKDFGIFEVIQRVWKTEVPESFPAKLYKDKRISGWRENYIYKLPSGDIVAVYEDVTERKKGEEALEEAEQRYKIVADFTYDWEFWRSPEGKMLYVSPACERITGYTPAQFMKDPRLMVKIILPEDKDIYAAHQARIKDLVLDKAIYRIKRKDGNVCWIEHVCRPILDDKGTFLGTRGSNRDITARKQAEEKLEESEDKFRLLFDTANEGIAVGQEGRVKYFNPKFAEILGYSMEEIQSKYLSEYIFPEDRDTVLNSYLKSLYGEKNDGILPFRIVSKSGEIRWVEIRHVLINWEDKPATLNFVTDITARKQVEEALQKSEEKYRTILEQMDEAYYETNLERNLTFFNDALPRLLGYTREELIGMNYRQYVPADHQAAHSEAFTRVYRTGVPAELHRQPRIKKDGSTIYVDLFIVPIKNAKGEITGVRGVVRDVTARQKAEEELQFRAELLDSANDSIYVMDLDGNFVYANETCYKSRGYTLEEFMSSNIHDLIAPGYSAMVDQRIAEVVSKKELVFETAHLRKDGSSIPVEIHTRPIIYNGQTCLLSTARDITARKKAEDALRKSEEQYRLLAENADDVIWTLDAGMNYTYISPSIRKLTGFEPEEAVQLPLEKVLTPQSQWSMLHELELDWENIIQGKSGPRKIEFEQYRKDGSTVWVETVVHTLYSEAGQLAGFMGASRDITERKQTEQRLRESEGKFSATFMATSDPSAITEAESGKIIDANPAWEHWTGYSHDELINANTLDLNIWAEPDQRDQMLEKLSRQGELIDHDIKVRMKDGQVRDVLFSARLIDAGGKQYLFSRARDITERNRIEKSLEQINRRLTDIIEFLPDATLAIDNDNKVILWNRAIEQMTGIPASEMIGKGDYAYTIPFYGEARPFLMDLVLKDNVIIRAEYPYILLDGDSFISETFCPALNGGKGAWVFAKASPLHDREGNIVGAIESIRDVTARKQSEEDLQKSEEKYRLLAENADDCIWTMDTMLKPTYVSPSIRKLRGLEPDEAMRETAQDQNAPESLKLVRRELKRSLEDANRGIDKSYRAVLEQYRKDRSTVWVETTIRPYRDDAGKFIGFIGVSRDVTERVKAEKGIEQVNRQMADILDFLPDATLAVDKNKNIVLWNQAIAKMTGIAAADMVGKGDHLYSVPFYGEARPLLMDLIWEDRQEIRDRYPYIIRDGDSLISEAFCPALYGGKGAWVFAKASPLHDRDGNIVGAIEAVRDITAKKQAEEALQHSEEQYRLLAENAEDVIWTVDTNFMYTYVSPSIFKLRGFKPEDIVGQPMISTMTPQSQQILAEQWGAGRNTIQKGEEVTWRGEIHAPRKDGSMVWTEAVVKTLHDDTGRHIGSIGVSRDISERKAADEALRESQAKYYELLENAGEAILIAQDGLVKYINNRLTEMTGYTAAEFIGSPLIHYVHKDDADMVSKIHEARMRGEKVESDYVFRVITRDGEIRWAEIHATLVTWEGRPASLNFLSDITESRKAQEALRESESRYNLLAELTDDVVWVLDRNLRMTYISPSVRKLSGFEPETVLQEGFANSLTPESLQEFLHLLKVNIPEIEGGADKNAIIELEQYHKDGSIIWVELNVKTQRDNTGKFIGFTGTSRDITARKISEHALKESEEKFRNIFEQSKDAIFIADEDGNILDINESLCALTGYSRDEILVMHLVPTKNARQKLLSAIEKTGSLRDYEYSLHRKDGTFISVLVSASVRMDKEGNILGYQGIIHDITERKRLEEERQKTARLESIGTLAGGIAHDFNNILGAVIGNISLAKTEIPAGHNAIDLIKDAEKAVMRAKELTRQLLTFSRGGAPVKKRIQLRNTIIDTANFATRGTNVKCRFDVVDDLTPADVDEGQISQVIQNLVINARQAMPTGGEIDITSENIILAEEMRLGRSLPLSPGTYIRIAVKDRGIGIKPEHLDKIFDPYFTTKQSGSGLGLATCYSIVRNHGGLISVESSPDCGSTFYVYLPASEGPAVLAGKDESKEVVRLNGRILVMDDEAALRTTISTMLKRLGFEHIEVAASGEEAIDLYIKALQAKQPFDVVILDLTVPGGMGGRETMEKLREVDPKVVAIVSSGYANEAIMADFTKYGFKGVIAKPYTFDELKSTLNELMDSLKHN